MSGRPMNSDSGTLDKQDHDVFAAEESPMMRYVLCLANAEKSRMRLTAIDEQR
jgi:sporulation-control protein spo0M